MVFSHGLPQSGFPAKKKHNLRIPIHLFVNQMNVNSENIRTKITLPNQFSILTKCDHLEHLLESDIKSSRLYSSYPLRQIRMLNVENSMSLFPMVFIMQSLKLMLSYWSLCSRRSCRKSPKVCRDNPISGSFHSASKWFDGSRWKLSRVP